MLSTPLVPLPPAAATAATTSSAPAAAVDGATSVVGGETPGGFGSLIASLLATGPSAGDPADGSVRPADDVQPAAESRTGEGAVDPLGLGMAPVLLPVVAEAVSPAPQPSLQIGPGASNEMLGSVLGSTSATEEPLSAEDAHAPAGGVRPVAVPSAALASARHSGALSTQRGRAFAEGAATPTVPTPPRQAAQTPSVEGATELPGEAVRTWAIETPLPSHPSGPSADESTPWPVAAAESSDAGVAGVAHVQEPLPADGVAGGDGVQVNAALPTPLEGQRRPELIDRVAAAAARGGRTDTALAAEGQASTAPPADRSVTVVERTNVPPRATAPDRTAQVVLSTAGSQAQTSADPARDAGATALGDVAQPAPVSQPLAALAGQQDGGGHGRDERRGSRTLEVSAVEAVVTQGEGPDTFAPMATMPVPSVTAVDVAVDEPVVRLDAQSSIDDSVRAILAAPPSWTTAEATGGEPAFEVRAPHRFAAALAQAEEQSGPEHVSRQVLRGLYMQWRDGVGEARVQLHPEHLGQVTLSLRVEQGNVAATVVADNETAQRWIEGHRDSLQQSLGEQGLKLDRLLVTTSREGRRDPEAGGQGARQRRQPPRRATSGVFDVRV